MKLTLKQFTKKHNFETKRFLQFLIEEELIEYSDVPNIFKSNHYSIEMTKSFIYINEGIYKIIENNTNFNNIVLNLDYMKDISSLNPAKRINEFLSSIEKKILFIDFEFIQDSYYEISFEFFEKGKLINKGYFFNSEVINRSYIYDNGSYLKVKSKEDKIENTDSNYSVNTTFFINSIISGLVEQCDYIVSYNISSEKRILKKNDIIIKNNKWIDLSTLLIGILDFKNKKGKSKNTITLKEFADFLDIPVNQNKFHYANYDTEILRKSFFKLANYIYDKRINLDKKEEYILNRK